MKWNIAAPFFQGSNATWIDDHVQDPDLKFIKIVRPVKQASWHSKNSKVTGLDTWLGHWSHAKIALNEPSDGLITLFPQLPTVAGLQKTLNRDNRPLIAWCFNLGECYPGLKQSLSKIALKKVSAFIVHSRAEIQAYADWLNFPYDRFEFVPLQRGNLPIEFSEETNEPFILSMGSAKRDYATLFGAVKKLGYKTLVIASPWALQNLEVPKNVRILSNLSHAECREYVQKALINVVPINNNKTASGQVTVIEAMKYARPVIATECIGTVDYIQSGKNGLLVPPGSVDALASAIEELWNNASFRTQLGTDAKRTAEENYSDSATAMHLRRILSKHK
jgi:glycosyltransferase involved in cell wall biosynthesis